MMPVLAHGGSGAHWEFVAVGALVPLIAVVVIVVLTERKRR